MSDLYTETRKLLLSTELTMEEICAAAHVRPRWLSLVKIGHFRDPGVVKIQRLHDVLTKKNPCKAA